MRIYGKYKNYEDRILRCKYITAGNLIDSLDYNGALEIFKETLEISRKINRQLHVYTSMLNMGIVYNQIGDAPLYSKESIKFPAVIYLHLNIRSS